MKRIGSTYGETYTGIIMARIQWASQDLRRYLGMMPGDYGFWMTLARRATRSSGYPAGRWIWSRR